MSRNFLVTLVIIAVVLVAGWWLLTRSQQTSNPTPAPEVVQSPSPVESSPSAESSEGAMMKEGETKVTISSAGFSPKSITIKVDDTVTWTNEDSADHTVNSSPHPVHTDYPPLNLGVIKPGESKSLAFPKAGTYKYHDHLNTSLFGTITVQ